MRLPLAAFIAWISLIIGLLASAAEAGAKQLPSFRDCPICSEMVVIPSGRFTMGSPTNEFGRKDDEGPQTIVEVHSFAIGRTDVTRAQWTAFVADTGRADGLGCAFSGLPRDQAGTASWRHLGFTQGDEEPVVCVSWREARAYLDWLSAKTDRRYRLPSEAEWEYAARAGSKTAYPWGNQPSHDRANFGSDTCCTGAIAGRDTWLNTSPVGSFAPNGFGLYDMIGNAWQWTADCYVPSLAARPKDATVVDQPDCRFRVARGGTWGDTPALIRSASRNYAPPPHLTIEDYRSAGFGFRIVTDDLSPPSNKR
jgi:formylglycine-generating enzyme required for sulfatase activity